MSIEVRNLSRILVEVHEDKHYTDRRGGVRRELCTQLERLGVPVVQAQSLPFDILWTVDGEPVGFDLKTPVDLIASAVDGRVHKQIQAMEEKGCIVYGILQEGRDSEDGITVGYGSHAWDVERYDNLKLSLQAEGAKVVCSADPSRTAARIASLYRWTAKAERASWRHPIRPSYSLKRDYGDPAYRAAIEALMAIFPKCGEERANALLDALTIAEVFGTTEESIEVAAKRWITVDGVGKGLASAWKEVLLGDYRIGG